MNRLPDEVDQLPLVMVGWMTDQLIQLETDPKKWWERPEGFGLVDTDPDEDPWFNPDAAAQPPEGWQRLPMYTPDEEVTLDG